MAQMTLGMRSRKMLDYDFTAAWKKIPKCLACGNEFCVRFDRDKRTRRPMILDCLQHCICEYCIFSSRNVQIHCKDCNVTTTLDRHRAIRSKIEFNYYLYGLIAYIENSLSHDLKYIPLTSKSAELRGQNECSECNVEFTNQYCMQCGVAYCKSCFEKVHKFGKALKKHHLTVLENKNIIYDKDLKKCYTHKKNFDHYCTTCKRLICPYCIPDAHNSHVVVALETENEKYIPQMQSLIETLNIAKEHNRQAQKEIKLVEKKYEEYAYQTIDQIFKYFIALHAGLQKLEQKYLVGVKDKIMTPINQARLAHATLARSHDSLEEIKTTLQHILKGDSPNLLFSKVIERTKAALRTAACNVELKEPNENPFVFEETTDTVKEIEKCLQFEINEISFNSKILSFYGDANNCNDYGSIVEDLRKKLKNLPMTTNVNLNATAPNNVNNSLLNVTIDISHESNQTTPTASLTSCVNSQMVHVSHIKSPEHFYVQNQIFLSVAGDFKEACMEEAEFAAIPNYIEIDNIYLIYNPGDKGWYRGKVIYMAFTDVYRVFLVDYGDSLTIPKQRIREISDDLRLRPYGAIECSFYGIKPIGSLWTDEPTHLMSEIIQNKPLHMIILKDNEPVSYVDLVTTYTKYPTSVRDALIYTNLAEQIPIENNHDMPRRIQILQDIKKTLIPTVTTRFFKNVFKDGENFRVAVTNIVNPEEFYCVKYDHQETLDNLEKEIDEEYKESQEKLLNPQSNMPCAVFIKGNWYRARYINTMGDGNNRVWLVDGGYEEIVNWKQIRVLDDKFLMNNEFAFQCSLIDIEPLQENEYSWTIEAIEEFKRITKNPTLQIFIHRSKPFRYKVVLYVIKKTVDINVNALMVQYNHAIATGAESAVVEFPKAYSKVSSKADQGTIKTKTELSTTATSCSATTKSKATTSTLQRTKIKISHIVSPGEFYIQLVDHLNGITTLHKEIQAAQGKTDLSLIMRDNWMQGENCLVLTSLKKEGILQWYRGIITDVTPSDCNNDGIEDEYDDNGNIYTVFLCDHGKKVTNITCQQLSRISNMFGRVCNGAILCHLACVQPTGGLDSWSYSSIDEFKNLTNKYESFGASIQGNRQGNSIPIVLWGLTTEFSDPLSPNIYKWVNINKVLVNCGLAHLLDKFSPAQQTEDAFKSELQKGKDTFAQWMEYFNNRVDNTMVENTINAENEYEYDEEEQLAGVEQIVKGEITSWLAERPIQKTVFTAYPTYVDNDAIVYLHDATNHQFLDRLKDRINEKLKDFVPEEETHWYKGQPCLARYHADMKFYRAIVKEIKPDNIISVQFIDYGNIEDCLPSELCSQMMFNCIPIKCNKYCIDRIIPKNGAKSWPIETLDFIHAHIVGKLCTIRVSPNQEKKSIKNCSIRVETYDLAELLWNSGLADKISDSNTMKDNSLSHELLLDALLIKKKHKDIEEIPSDNEDIQVISDNNDHDNNNNDDDDDDENEIIIPSHTSPIRDPMDPDEYQKMFEKKELEDLYKSIAMPSDDENSDEDIVELECTYRSGYWQNKCEDDDCNNDGINNDNNKHRLVNSNNSSISSFNPQETSSVKSHFAGIDKFEQSKIPYGMTKFYCEVTFLKNSTHLYIFPFLAENQQRMTEMSRRIQSIAKTSQPLFNFEPNTACLAQYTVDNQWYRAIIRSYSPETEKVDVLYIDFLNAEMVTTKMIKKIPPQLIDFPLRNIEVKLSGIKSNPRWREVDIQRKLSDTLAEHTKIYVKIIKSGRLPEVELYESQNEKKLIYENLITERFYLTID